MRISDVGILSEIFTVSVGTLQLRARHTSLTLDAADHTALLRRCFRRFVPHVQEIVQETCASILRQILMQAYASSCTK